MRSPVTSAEARGEPRNASGSPAVPAPAARSTCDLMLTNGIVLTLDPALAEAKALLARLDKP